MSCQEDCNGINIINKNDKEEEGEIDMWFDALLMLSGHKNESTRRTILLLLLLLVVLGLAIKLVE